MALIGDAKELYTAKRSSGVDTSDPSLADAWARVRSDDTDDNWCLFGYAEGSSTAIALLGSGDNGVEGMLSCLNDDIVAWGGLRASAGGSIKFIRLFFQGSNVGGMKKGKASLHKNAVFNLLDGASCDVTISEGLEGFTLEAVLEQARRLMNMPELQLA